MTSLIVDQIERPEIAEVSYAERLFKIRVADTAGHRNAVSLLINKMYGWRGYAGSHQAHAHPNRVTLVASEGEEPLGTITLGLDSESGLLVDEVYENEVRTARIEGRRLCELSKLAVDPRSGSKRVLAALFHISFIYARVLNRVTDAFIEVNPRHVSFYQRLLGFKVVGEERVCPRVNAPAQLLQLDLTYMEERIRQFGGRSDLAQHERSLYPFFFSAREARGIEQRLMRAG